MERSLHLAPSYAGHQPQPLHKGQRELFFFHVCFCIPQPVEVSESVLTQCTQFYNNLVPGKRAAESPGFDAQARCTWKLFCTSAGAS